MRDNRMQPVVVFCFLEIGEEGRMKKRTVFIFVGLILLFFIGSFIVQPPAGEHIAINEAMRDAVLHEVNQISLFGIIDVSPAVISGLVVTAILLAMALVLRLFVIPKFTMVPGKLQLILEMVVGYFSDLAKTNSPHEYKLLGAYIFGAGMYIFFGTLLELFGFQWITTKGVSISLPAPLADINAAISLGVLSYLFIVFGGVKAKGSKGLVDGLKEFSLPISMSFRLFGSLLSGLMVTELVYHYIQLSYVLPVIVAVLFTLLHAVIQAYVLTMLTSIYYGSMTAREEEPSTTTMKSEASA